MIEKEQEQMSTLEGRDFFENIRRSVKISHFVASIIPLALLAYFSVKYVYPYVSGGNTYSIPLNIIIILLLAVIVSVLGLILTTRATNSSIRSAQNLNAKLNSLFEVTKQFRETMYLDILLENIIKSAMKLTGAEGGSLLLYDEDRHLQVKVTSGRHSRYSDKIRIKPGKGIASWVAEQGKPLLLHDVSKDPRYDPALDSEAGTVTKSVNCVPLIYANETIGVIEMRNKRQGYFSEQDQAILCSLADQASLSISQNKTHEQQQSDFIHVTEMLISAQDYMQNRRGHARRVAGYANLIGKKLNFSEAALKKLYYACLLHDIGMLKIDSVDQSQMEKFRQHPKLGYDLIKPISLWSDLADIILYHHEKCDGSGYPMSIKGDDIPLEARIVAVADTFDILTNNYSASQVMSEEKAIIQLENNAGTKFDSHVVEALKSSIEESESIV